MKMRYLYMTAACALFFTASSAGNLSLAQENVPPPGADEFIMEEFIIPDAQEPELPVEESFIESVTESVEVSGDNDAGLESDMEADAQESLADQEPQEPSDAERLAKMSSLFFTFWEHNAIKDARRATPGVARAPTNSELARASGPAEDRVKPPPEERDITLGGIVYASKKDWTIWLNGKRVTPEAVPPEVIDLNVYNEYIELKWFDEWSNQIYPIRLKAHQRFNIDTRIFLPG